MQPEIADLVREMREGLANVTPGPWVIIPAREYDGDDDELDGSYTSPASIEGSDGNPVCCFGTLEGSGCLFENEADYAHLTRCSPDNIRALLDAYAAQSARISELEAERDEARKAVAGKEWFERKVALEGDADPSTGNSVGRHTVSELERIVFDALPQWAQKRIVAAEALSATLTARVEELERALNEIANSYLGDQTAEAQYVRCTFIAANALARAELVARYDAALKGGAS